MTTLTLAPLEFQLSNALTHRQSARKGRSLCTRRQDRNQSIVREVFNHAGMLQASLPAPSLNGGFITTRSYLFLHLVPLRKVKFCTTVYLGFLLWIRSSLLYLDAGSYRVLMYQPDRYPAPALILGSCGFG